MQIQNAFSDLEDNEKNSNNNDLQDDNIRDSNIEDNFLDKPILEDEELNTKTVTLDSDDLLQNESLNDNREEKDLPIVIKMAEDIDNIDLFLKHKLYVFLK